MSKIGRLGRDIDSGFEDATHRTIDKTVTTFPGPGMAQTDTPMGVSAGLTQLMPRAIEVVTNNLLGVYEVKEILESGDDALKPKFWATHVNLDPRIAVGTKGLAISTREGRWGFFTEEHPIGYGGCCRLSEAAPAVTSADTLTMTNANAGPGAGPLDAAGSEFRLAIKFERPFIRVNIGAHTQNWITFFQIKNAISIGNQVPGRLFGGWSFYINYITADFDYTGVGCATWNSLNCFPFGNANWPSTDCTPVGGVYRNGATWDFANVQAGATLQEDDAADTDGSGRSVYLYNPAATNVPIYGVMVSWGQWVGGGIGLQNCTAATTLLTTDIMQTFRPD